LLICGHLAIRAGVDANWVLVIAEARKEDVRGVCSRCVVGAPETVVQMVAKGDGPRVVGIASLEAELTGADELAPRRGFSLCAANGAGELV